MISKSLKKTNVRRFASDVQNMLADLRTLMVSANTSAWAIGDLVEELKQVGVKVKDQAQVIGASRQRLSELRRTAAAFPPSARRLDRDIHYHTVAARAARRLRLSPVAVLDEIISQQIDSTRAATRYLAERIRMRRANIVAVQVNRMADHDDPLLNHCHHDDYRNVLGKLPNRSVTTLERHYDRLDPCDATAAMASYTTIASLKTNESNNVFAENQSAVRKAPQAAPDRAKVRQEQFVTDPIQLVDWIKQHGYNALLNAFLSFNAPACTGCFGPIATLAKTGAISSVG